jgi:uncharacterized protein
MTNKHGDFIWYELMTDDPDSARQFYTAVVGWDIEKAASGDIDYRMISTANGPVCGLMHLTPDMAAGGARPCWLGYIGVEDVDKAAAAVASAGGAVHVPPRDIPGVGRFALLADPQGAMIYVMRGASPESSHSFSADVPRAGHCAWNELHAKDSGAAMAFYTSQFGWVKDGEMDMGPMGKYEFIRHGAMIGAIMTSPPQVPVSVWNYYFRVPDIDAAAAAITENGGQVLRGPMEVPGGDWSMNAMDPQGAMFALVGRKN